MFSELSVRYLYKLTRPVNNVTSLDSNILINSRTFIAPSQILHVQIPRIQVDVANSVAKAFANENFVPKLHPGVQFRGKVCLPSQFVEGADIVLTKNEIKLSEAEKQAFNNYLWSRRLPIERRDYRVLVDKIESSVRAKDAIMEPFLNKEELVSLESKRLQQTKERLKKLVYHWEPLNFDIGTSLSYLTVRSAGEYAALYKIFYELSIKDPKFQPKSLLDFGSGLATSVWASNAFWNASLKEHICVDTSRDINDIAELILKRGNPQRALMFPGVFFRQFLPESQKTQYDLVTSAYSLLELPSAKERINTLNTLWRKSSDYIVIVERGTAAGFQILNEARDFILRLDRKTKAPANCHVVSPCPHDMLCPQYNSNWEGNCSFDVLHKTLLPLNKEILQRESFCYVVIKKGERSRFEENWPRLVVSAPMKRSGHCICRACMPEGRITEIIVTKGKHSKSLYRAARKSKLGDFLPIKEIPIDLQSSSPQAEDSSSDDDDELDLENDFIVDDNPSGTEKPS